MTPQLIRVALFASFAFFACGVVPRSREAVNILLILISITHKHTSKQPVSTTPQSPVLHRSFCGNLQLPVNLYSASIDCVCIDILNKPRFYKHPTSQACDNPLSLCRVWWRSSRTQRRLSIHPFTSDGHNFNPRPNGRVPRCPRPGTEETIVDQSWRSAPVAADRSTTTGSKCISERGSQGWTERRQVGVCEKGCRHWAGHNRDNGEARETCAM